MEKVFAYGSLADPQTQQKIFGRLPGAKFSATLRDWEKKTDREYPYIIPHQGKQVEGVVVLLTTKELIAADRWEKVPNEYKRRLLKVEIKPGKYVEVWVYVAANHKI